jgi:hypothetical protein
MNVSVCMRVQRGEHKRCVLGSAHLSCIQLSSDDAHILANVSHRRYVQQADSESCANLAIRRRTRRDNRAAVNNPVISRDYNHLLGCDAGRVLLSLALWQIAKELRNSGARTTCKKWATEASREHCVRSVMKESRGLLSVCAPSVARACYELSAVSLIEQSSRKNMQGVVQPQLLSRSTSTARWLRVEHCCE